MAKVKKEVCASEEDIAEVENKIRDLINLIKIRNNEELEVGEGKKIEDDTAEELVEKLREIAEKLGLSFD